MKKSYVYGYWAFMYLLSVFLSFVAAEGILKTLLAAFGMLFFLPPFYLVYRARKEDDQKTVRFLRLLSIVVLSLSLVLLVLNFLSVYFSAQAGLVLYVLLALFSAPMLSCQYWALSLFLWASLLMVTLLRFNRDESSPDQR